MLNMLKCIPWVHNLPINLHWVTGSQQMYQLSFERAFLGIFKGSHPNCFVFDLHAASLCKVANTLLVIIAGMYLLVDSQLVERQWVNCPLKNG